MNEVGYPPDKPYGSEDHISSDEPAISIPTQTGLMSEALLEELRVKEMEMIKKDQELEAYIKLKEEQEAKHQMELTQKMNEIENKKKYYESLEVEN